MEDNREFKLQIVGMKFNFTKVLYLKSWWIKIPLIVLLIIGFAGLTIWLIQFLWNYTITDLFGIKSISFWQAGALGLLIKMLFADFQKDSNDSTSKNKSEDDLLPPLKEIE